MKQILTIIAVLLCLQSSGQSVVYAGNTTQLLKQRGGFVPVRYFHPPMSFSAMSDSLGMVWIDSTTTKKLMWHTGVYRRYVASERYVDSLFATAVTGVTQQTLDDTAAAIRADITGGGDVTTSQLNDSMAVVRDSLSDHWTAIMARELLSNKVTSFASPDNTTYPTTAAVNSLVGSYKLKSDSVANDGYTRRDRTQHIADSVAGLIPTVTGYLPISDSITVYATQYGQDTTSANLYAWAWATFLTAETDPLSFHKSDSNTAGNAITYSYFWTNIPSTSGFVQTSDTALMLTPYVRKADSNFNEGYESFYHAVTTYQPIGTYITPSDTAAMLSAYARLLIYFPADTTISAAYTLTSRDFHRTIHCTNGSNIALTIPTGLGTTFECVVLAEGAGTVTPTTSSTTFYYQPTSTTKIKSQGGATIRSWATANSYLIIGSLE